MININHMTNFLSNSMDIIRNNFLKILVTSFIVLPLIIFLIVSHPHAKQVEAINKRHNEMVLNELKDINSQMQIITENPNQEKTYEALQLIQQDATSIQKLLSDVAKSADLQKVSNQITGVREDVDTQINDLKKTVASGMTNKQFLEPEALPFHIISIDVIAGQPYVTVNYANHIFPLAIGDLLAGWRITSASYDSKMAELVNEKNQYVRVNLQGD